MKRDDAKYSGSKAGIGFKRESGLSEVLPILTGVPMASMAGVSGEVGEGKPSLLNGAIDAMESRPIARRVFLQGGVSTALLFIAGPYAARYLMNAAAKRKESASSSQKAQTFQNSGGGAVVADRTAALPSFSVHYLR